MNIVNTRSIKSCLNQRPKYEPAEWFKELCVFRFNLSIGTWNKIFSVKNYKKVEAFQYCEIQIFNHHWAPLPSLFGHRPSGIHQSEWSGKGKASKYIFILYLEMLISANIFVATSCLLKHNFKQFRSSSQSICCYSL